MIPSPFNGVIKACSLLLAQVRVTFAWWAATTRGRAGWRSTSTERGAPSVTTAGVCRMLRSSAVSWDTARELVDPPASSSLYIVSLMVSVDVNLSTAMLAGPSFGKRPIKVPNLRSLKLFSL